MFFKLDSYSLANLVKCPYCIFFVFRCNRQITIYAWQSCRHEHLNAVANTPQQILLNLYLYTEYIRFYKTCKKQHQRTLGGDSRMLKTAAETKLVIITHCSSIYVRVWPCVLRFPSRVLRPSPCFTAPCIRVTISARFLMYKCPEIQKYKTLVYCRYRKRSLTFQAYALCERETRFSNISL